ncbi:MAG: D-alanyl-D-alanine carboxypeptidase [Chthonomonadaceae bacterium]|nr:D-alanyl-D-alanine carboxypeptidase [Chthonomonadaceae bacterium]
MISCLLAFACVSRLDAILDDSKLQGAWVSATVCTLGGETLYERNPGIRMMPASNEKLASVAFAFAKLGPEHRFQTRFWKVREGVRVQAEGDPLLTYAQLKAAGAKLGIGKDTAVYVHQPFRAQIGPAWEWDDLPNKYAAPVSGLTVDRGSFEIWAEDGKAFFLPESYGTRTVRVTEEGKPSVRYDPSQRVALLYGGLPKARTRLDTLALPAPDRAAVAALGGLYAVGGDVPAREPDFVIESPPLAEIAHECLTKSDNNLAEMLLLAAAGKEGPLGDAPYDVATKRLGAFLEGMVGVAKGDWVPQDGSGLSRHNMVASRGLARVLVWAAKQSWNKSWESSLASSSVGTLSGRLKGTGFRGKTGTLHLASALSGYVEDGKGRTLVVSLVFNHFLCSSAEARGIQDTFVTELQKEFLDGTPFALRRTYESPHAHAELGTVAGHWIPGSVHHPLAARERHDGRAQPDHALLPAQG